LKSETKQWLIKALNDFKTAEKLLNFSDEEIITDSVCFHSQQAVEKLLKAYLVEKGVESVGYTVSNI